MLFLQLFYTFFKIGLFGFGGGYAMLSMIQGEVVNRYGWISASEFTDIVAVSQMTPGPIGINSATYVGYSAVVSAGYAPWVGIAGAAVATLAVVMPSFLIMLALSRLLLRYMNHPTVKSIFATLRPAVVGLLASAALLLMNTENFGSPDTSSMQFGISLLLFAASFIAVWKFKVSPILLIILCGAIGGIIYSI
ncbi:MAG: chromate transporter [Bacteroidaceae bacterium]|nr:chromate transporter [Bacteroidaceae bacterium]